MAPYLLISFPHKPIQNRISRLYITNQYVIKLGLGFAKMITAVAENRYENKNGDFDNKKTEIIYGIVKNFPDFKINIRILNLETSLGLCGKLRNKIICSEHTMDESG